MSIIDVAAPAAGVSDADHPAVVGVGWPLTGRAEELGVIARIAEAPAGSGIVLAGAAGVGKTRLAREALDRARDRGWRCCYVTATESARSIPLGAFSDYVTGFGSDSLRRVQEVVDAVAGGGDHRRVVVAIDDAHLLDELSAVVVHQLVRRRLASVVLTLRTGEDVPDAITALWKNEMLPRLEVQPLAESETTMLVEFVLRGRLESSSARRIWHHTRGNVLYLRQLIADELAAGRLGEESGCGFGSAPARSCRRR